MPVTLPSEFVQQVERPHQADPWLWLWEIVLDEPLTNPATAPTWTRLTPNPTDVVWPPGSNTKFYSVNMEHSEIESDGEGRLPTLELAIDNTARFLMPWLDQIDLEGNRATLWLVNQKHIESAQAFLRWDWEVAGAAATRKSVGLTLELPNFFDRRVPGDRYNAQRCRWVQFGGEECGYVINSAAGFTQCGRTPDDCNARGDDEVARGLPRLHPKRFGGFLGIPIQRAR